MVSWPHLMDVKHLILFLLCVSSTVLTVCSLLANSDVHELDDSQQKDSKNKSATLEEDVQTSVSKSENTQASTSSLPSSSSIIYVEPVKDVDSNDVHIAPTHTLSADGQESLLADEQQMQTADGQKEQSADEQHTRVADEYVQSTDKQQTQAVDDTQTQAAEEQQTHSTDAHSTDETQTQTADAQETQTSDEQHSQVADGQHTQSADDQIEKTKVLPEGGAFVFEDKVEVQVASSGDGEEIKAPKDVDLDSKLDTASLSSEKIPGDDTQPDTADPPPSSGSAVGTTRDGDSQDLAKDSLPPPPGKPVIEEEIDVLKELNEEEEEKTEKDDFPSFTEWTQKVLAEEEKNKQDGQGEAPVSSKLAKRKLNYASRECGAKITANNPESEKVKSVLTASKDEYMINPCSAKKWFVVELCEPINVKSVDVASFELFSSQPKKFRISVSDRYPQKEWKDLGTYDILEERSVQSFTITDDTEYFSKYIKVELLEHYGGEHYCPLTLFRVFGTAVDYDDEYLGSNTGHTGQDADSDDEVEEGDNDNSGPTNLFMSAKDTVMNLVKKVLNVEETSGSQVQMDNDSRHVNGSQEAATDNYLLPCVPEANIREATPVKGATEQSIGEPKPQTIYPTVDKNAGDNASENKNIDDGSSIEGDESIGPDQDIKADSNSDDQIPDVEEENKEETFVRKLEDDEQIPSEAQKDNSLVTLLDSSSNFPLLTRPDTCMMCMTCKGQLCVTNKGCAYYQLLTGKTNQTEVRGQANVTANHNSSSVDPTVSNIIEDRQEQKSSDSTITTDSLPEPSKDTSSVLDKAVDDVSEQKLPTAAEPLQKTSSNSVNEEASKQQPVPSINVVSGEPIQTSSDSLSTSKESDPITSVNSHEPVTLQPSHTVKEQAETGETTPVLTTAEEVSSAQSVVKPASQTSMDKIPDTGERTTAEPHLPEVISVHDATNQGESIKVTTTVVDDTVSDEQLDASSVRERPLDLVKIPAMPLLKRESTIMRLNNRMKSLEVNVSLSSRFLEELSQRYRKQSDDMMKILNKTMAKLNNITKSAEATDQIQQERIAILEARLENLTGTVVDLSKKLDVLNEQLVERQMVWTTVQGALLTLALLVCLRWGRILVASTGKLKLVKEPTMPPIVTPRRFSFSQLSTPSKDCFLTGLKKHNSDTMLCSDSNFTQNVARRKIDLVPEPELKDGPKKKKKKKHKRTSSKSSVQLEDKPKTDTNTSQGLNSAGLLFGSATDENLDTGGSPCSTNRTGSSCFHHTEDSANLSRSSSSGGIHFTEERHFQDSESHNSSRSRPPRPPPPKPQVTRPLSRRQPDGRPNLSQSDQNFDAKKLGQTLCMSHYIGVEDVKVTVPSGRQSVLC